MKNRIIRVLTVTSLVYYTFNINGCSTESVSPPQTVMFTRDIQPIFAQNCTYPGCHATAHDDSEHLALSDWHSIMVNGDNEGMAIIPYNAFWSDLVAHINLDTNLSLIATPRMPKYGPPFSQGHPLPQNVVNRIIQWINEGAKDDNGTVAYSNIVHKCFVTNQASDNVAVIDRDNFFVIRLVHVGTGGLTLAAPHNVEVDKQGRYFYVTLINQGYVEKYDANTYQKLGRFYFGKSPAHVVITADGSKGYVTDYDLSGLERFAKSFDTQNMVVLDTISDITMNASHGEKFTHDGQFLVTVSLNAEYVQIIRTKDDMIDQTIPVADDVPPNGNGTGQYQPIAVSISPDDHYAFVTCNRSNEVRVLDLQSRNIVRVIPVGVQPIQSDCSSDNQWCYVANRGSNTVTVISISSLTVYKTIPEVGVQPHGVSFTPDGHYAYVSCESQQQGNPFVHHPTTGNKLPGTTAVIDAWNGHIKIKNIEMSSFPAGVSVTKN